MKLMYKSVFSLVLAFSVAVPNGAIADHIPDSLSQDLNTNYIACFLAVDDAHSHFRHALQSTCVERLGEICSGRNGLGPPSQTINCLYFEMQRGIHFLESATPALPASIEKKGFFGHGYQRRRQELLRRIGTFKDLRKPQSVDEAAQKGGEILSDVITLFWLARETGTSLDTYAKAPFGTH